MHPARYAHSQKLKITLTHVQTNTQRLNERKMRFNQQLKHCDALLDRQQRQSTYMSGLGNCDGHEI